MTRPRNDQHPPWCTREEPTSTGSLHHRSAQVRVGHRRPGRLTDRGQVTAWLTSTGSGPTWLTVNAAHMTGVTVDINLEDATAFSEGVARLLEQAELVTNQPEETQP